MSTEMLQDGMAAYFSLASMRLQKKKKRITMLMKKLNDVKESGVSGKKKETRR